VLFVVSPLHVDCNLFLTQHLNQTPSMKKIFTFGFFVVLAFATRAQVTITNATFPTAGDSYVMATDTAVGEEVVFPFANGQQSWDFSALTPDFLDTTTFVAASTGVNEAEYPTANLLVEDGAGGELYYQSTATKIDALGYAGPDPTGLGINAIIKTDPPLPFRVAPLNFGDLGNYESDVNFPFAAGFLPDSLTGGISFDSLRLRINIQRVEFVDAFGDLHLPGGYFEVLRQRRLEYTETRLDAFLGFTGWVDITDLIGLDFLGTDTTITYLFYNNDYKSPMAEVSLNADSTFQRFQYNPIAVSSTQTPNIASKHVKVSPNPAQVGQNINVQLDANYAGGTLTLRAADGRLINTQTLTDNREINIEAPAAGIYLLTLYDTQGRLLQTAPFLTK
jgi:hypothetical protein